MENCNHPQLTQIVNIENGGINSRTYQCQKCKDLLTLTIEPMTIGVVFGIPQGTCEVCPELHPQHDCRMNHGALSVHWKEKVVPSLSDAKIVHLTQSSLRKVTPEMVKLAMLSATGNFPAEIAESINAQLAEQPHQSLTVTAEMVSLLQDIKNRYGSGLCNCHDVTTDNPTCLSTRVSTAIESLAAQSSSLVTKEKS